jgi:uncharacterized membrane protein YphA (DoxX/SURF4 family)
LHFPGGVGSWREARIATEHLSNLRRTQTMFRELLKPHIHLGTFLLRLGLAAIFIFHGFLKLAQGGGSNWHAQLDELTQIAVTWGELICGFLLLIGFVSRMAALGGTVIQVGAIVLQTGHWDFINTDYIPPNANLTPTGYEYNVALIVMCLAILAMGSGKVSLDYLFFGSREAPPPAPSTPGSTAPGSPGS